jgi:bifunctional DNA-binding transcriptional regulator/antitoxin component of YhaV-PrlF toxin-antitoxin module
VQFDPKGRILIPSDARNDIGWSSSDQLILWRTAVGFEIIPRDQFIKRVQSHFLSKFDPERSLVNELILQRQEEAAIEERNH